MAKDNGGDLRRVPMTALEAARIVQWSLGRACPQAVFNVERRPGGGGQFLLEMDGHRFKVEITEVTQ